MVLTLAFFSNYLDTKIASGSNSCITTDVLEKINREELFNEVKKNVVVVVNSARICTKITCGQREKTGKCK